MTGEMVLEPHFSNEKWILWIVESLKMESVPPLFMAIFNGQMRFSTLGLWVPMVVKHCTNLCTFRYARCEIFTRTYVSCPFADKFRDFAYLTREIRSHQFMALL